jgi:hypothetical protein
MEPQNPVERPVAAIQKSTRHQRIIGNFGEYLICNWLSRSGFEVAVVDHTGLDLIAYHPGRNERLGITVKSRTRREGRETSHVRVFGATDRDKLLLACRAFSCEPWIGVYETTEFADLYLTSLRNFEEHYWDNPGGRTGSWRMHAQMRARYRQDPEVRHIRIGFEPNNWFPTEPLPESGSE